MSCRGAMTIGRYFARIAIGCDFWTVGDLSERFEIDVYAYVLTNGQSLSSFARQANLSKVVQWSGTAYETSANETVHSCELQS